MRRRKRFNMLERIGLPIAFVVLWSSAFVAAKSGVAYATPFAFLAVRFAIVAAIFAAVSVIVAVWRHQRKMAQSASPAITRRALSGSICVGLLLHGFYLGCSFYAMANGLGAALTALIVSTQPLLTTALAITLFGEKPARRAMAWHRDWLYWRCRGAVTIAGQRDADITLAVQFNRTSGDYRRHFIAEKNWQSDRPAAQQCHSGHRGNAVFCAAYSYHRGATY
jgi:hypothetical protein